MPCNNISQWHRTCIMAAPQGIALSDTASIICVYNSILSEQCWSLRTNPPLVSGAWLSLGSLRYASDLFISLPRYNYYLTMIQQIKKWWKVSHDQV